MLDPAASCRLLLGRRVAGIRGPAAAEGVKQFDLRGPTTVAEMKLSPLIEAANLVPQCKPQSPYPAVTRDVNLVVDEAVRWADVAATVSRALPSRISRAWSIATPIAIRNGSAAARRASCLRSRCVRPEGTLTSQQADEVRDRIVAACRAEHGAELRA